MTLTHAAAAAVRLECVHRRFARLCSKIRDRVVSLRFARIVFALFLPVTLCVASAASDFDNLTEVKTLQKGMPKRRGRFHFKIRRVQPLKRGPLRQGKSRVHQKCRAKSWLFKARWGGTSALSKISEESESSRKYQQSKKSVYVTVMREWQDVIQLPGSDRSRRATERTS